MTNASTTVNNGKSNGKVKSDVSNVFRAASEQIDDVTSEVKEHVQNYSDELVKAVKKSPMKSVLIAGVIGVLLGKIFL